jgi:hypothetical protein
MTADATATPAASSRGSPSSAARIGDGDRGRGGKPAGRGREQQAAARAEIFYRRIAEEGDGGEHDGDDPDLARIDPAERPDRLIGQDGQRDKGHGQQHQSRSQFRPGDLLHPAVQLFARSKHARGGDCGPGGNPHVAEHRVGTQREGQHGSHRGGRGENAGGRVLGATEQGDDGGVDGERRAEHDPAAEARRAASRLRDGGDHAAEQP